MELDVDADWLALALVTVHPLNSTKVSFSDIPFAALNWFECLAGQMAKSEPNTSLDKYGEIQPSPLLDLEREREGDPLLPALPTNPKELEGWCALCLIEHVFLSS